MEAVYWVLTWACHRKCRHCYDDRFRPYVKDELKRVVGEGQAAYLKVLQNLPDDMSFRDRKTGARRRSLLVMAGGELLIDGVRDELTETPTEETVAAWNGYFFYHPFKGRFARAHERCPVTSRVLEALPGLCRRELVLFSALVPGTVVPPHQGPFNGRIRVHLCLTGAKGCYLRVGTQIREWEDGRVLAFDDSFEHQVCHRGPEVRVVLMFNVVQPGVPPNVIDRAAQAAVPDYEETEADRAARALLARTAWWK
jgi:hypothetical protein